NLSIAVPFLSSRNLSQSSFRYKLDDTNNKSFLKLNPQYIDTYHEQFLYGFAHNGLAYFLYTQDNFDHGHKETRLGRICKDDPQYSSYHEVPLQCQDSKVATTASLSIWLPDDSEQTDETHLYVAFEQNNAHKNS